MRSRKFAIFAIFLPFFAILTPNFAARALSESAVPEDATLAENSLEAQETASDANSALSENQETYIKNSCSTLKDNLRSVQYYDSRVRTALGPFYDEVLTNYLVPLNRRLASNNLGDASLTENQTALSEAKTVFASDYVKYQQSLESLVQIDCSEKPDEFYSQLQDARKKRAAVEKDAKKLENAFNSHLGLVRALRSSL